MTNIDQPSLFPDQNPTPEVASQPPVDLSEIARKIGAAARPFEYKDRTSEAASDQGHRYVAQPETGNVAEVAPIGREKSRRKHPSNRRRLADKTDRQLIEEPSRTRGLNRPEATFSPTQDNLAAYRRSKAGRDQLKRRLKSQEEDQS